VSSLIPRAVVHYSLHDPRTHTGGVETFARNLELVFERVHFMTPKSLDLNRIRSERLPVLCDNHWVLDWPDEIPVVGFQHGVAARKMLVSPSSKNWTMAKRQRRAAKRRNTLWVACAKWIGRSFARLHGNAAQHVLYHAVDLEAFDGLREGEASRLILHDGRSRNKGSRLWPTLQEAFPQWHFEALSCSPDQVPDRMRSARAFVHLSRYEGNSIVCNEAMAMNLPCLFTRVGLMLDAPPDLDVATLSPRRAFGRPRGLVRSVGSFLESLDARSYAPRRWVETYASLDRYRAGWRDVMADFDRMPWG